MGLKEELQGINPEKLQQSYDNFFERSASSGENGLDIGANIARDYPALSAIIEYIREDLIKEGVDTQEARQKIYGASLLVLALREHAELLDLEGHNSGSDTSSV